MNDSDTRTRLLRACYSFMLPVARILIRSGVGFREFSEIVRTAYVEIASSDHGLRGRPTNISRIAAMTGIGRKEVSRLRNLTAEYQSNPIATLHPLSDVLLHWFTDPAYVDRDGRPKALPFHGEPVSFSKLVREYAGDVPAGAVKIELVRRGSVSEDTHGTLHAIRRQVIPTGVDERVIAALVYGLRGLASTVAFNTAGEDLGPAGRLERLCLSEHLSETDIRRLHPVLRERARLFLDGLDDMLATVEKTGPDDGRRIGVGVYYFEED